MKPDHIKQEHWTPLCVITESLTEEEIDEVIKAFEHMGYKSYGGTSKEALWIHNLKDEAECHKENIDGDGNYFCEVISTKYIHPSNIVSVEYLFAIAYGGNVKENTPLSLNDDLTVTLPVKSWIKNMIVVGKSNGAIPSGYSIIKSKLEDAGYNMKDVNLWLDKNDITTAEVVSHFVSYENELFEYITASMVKWDELSKLKKQREELDKKIAELEGRY